ncbi:hypothetical protein BGW41_008381, partial [Actinomortierella wolfii]
NIGGLDYEDRETIQIYNIQANYRREFGAPTFEFGTHKSYVYAVTCNLTAEAWNITGHLSSYRPQRLYNIQSVTRLKIMAATLTTATASIQPRAVRGAYLIETSIITVSVPKLVGGLMIQLFYISIIVGLYIFMRKSKVYRSDDITYLIKKDAVEIGRRK